MPAATNASNVVELEPLEPVEPVSFQTGTGSKAPTPAKDCSVHPKLQSGDGGAFGLLRIHGVPPAAPAQTGTECRYILPRQALEKLYSELADLLASNSL